MNYETRATNHAEEQAAAQLSSIRKMVAALNCDYDRLEELRDMQTADTASDDELEELNDLEAAAGEYESREDAEQAIQEDPLSIELSGTWSLGETPVADEAYILLCTGGPAVRIVCELDDSMQPGRAYLQYQDWGTPWTDYYEPNMNDVLVEYASQFYFGD